MTAPVVRPESAPSPRLHDVPRRLAERLRDRAPEAFPLHEVRPAPPPTRAAAVDGSSAMILTGGAFRVGAYRGGALHVRDGAVAWVDVPEPALVLLGADDPDRDLSHNREREEMAAAEAALAHLGEGDVLLLDGLIPPGDASRTLRERARPRGIHVVGVAKRTRRLIGGVPAAPAAARHARELGIETWAAPLPSLTWEGPNFVARLNAADPWVFRFQFLPDEADPLALLGRIAGLSGHPAYPGYPFPLAMIHQQVVIDEAAQGDLVRALRAAADVEGADGEAWDLTFSDYHDLLTMGV